MSCWSRGVLRQAQHERLGVGSARTERERGASTGSARTVGCGLSTNGAGAGCFDRLSTNGWVWAQHERSGSGGCPSSDLRTGFDGVSAGGWPVGRGGVVVGVATCGGNGFFGGGCGRMVGGLRACVGWARPSKWAGGDVELPAWDVPEMVGCGGTFGGGAPL